MQETEDFRVLLVCQHNVSCLVVERSRCLSNACVCIWTIFALKFAICGRSLFIHFAKKSRAGKKKNKQIAFYMHLQKNVFLCILVSKIENRGKRAIKMSELKRKMAWPIWYLWSEHRTHFEYILKGTGTNHMKNCNIRLTASTCRTF